MANTITDLITYQHYELTLAYTFSAANIGTIEFDSQDPEFSETTILNIAIAAKAVGLAVSLIKEFKTLQVLDVDMSIVPPTFDFP